MTTLLQITVEYGSEPKPKAIPVGTLPEGMLVRVRRGDIGVVTRRLGGDQCKGREYGWSKVVVILMGSGGARCAWVDSLEASGDIIETLGLLTVKEVSS